MTARADQAALPRAGRRLLRVPLICARGIDRRDGQVVRSCFADDAYAVPADWGREALPALKLACGPAVPCRRPNR